MQNTPLEEAISTFGPPQIVNADQGSQFTSLEWIETVKQAGARGSMDGKGRWVDNVSSSGCGGA